ncbi:type 2 lanthipeptide synthetase LanM [Halorussus lipolyticus]|uniref:type 2 lanthipeptide synthetase LanM n=1 Tax=Halorussus lipolyticus TaxID=3034024 RepID=UPI0023E8955F|nr:type 2 lanthipeptide synthetase LanM [Halorussus sp. DT80]
MRQTLLADCAARSRSLAARLDSTEETSLPPDEDPDDLLADWREVFDSDDEFRERLDFADRSVEDVRKSLRADESSSDESIPEQFETAERVVDRAVEYDSAAAESLVARHADSPFVHLVAPLAAAARDSVSLDVAHDTAAFESLVDWLFDRLTTVFQHPLFILFKTYQKREYPDREFSDASGSTVTYDEFVAGVRDADYEPIFEEYPVLLELLGVVTNQWHELLRRLGQRIPADRDALERTFADGEDLGRLTDVTPLSDDPHGEGEVVLRLDFENCTVVYKPRSVGGEAAFGAVLDWTNAHAEIPALYAPAVLDRGEYGWMEFVSHSECDSPGGVERFYERMGALTALAFVLGSTDLHHENVVASGEHPVVVDQETALSPQVGSSNKPVSPAMDSLMEDSVLNTVLIPFAKETGDQNDGQTSAGLTDLAGEQRREKRPNFRRPNTDAMDLGFDKPYRLDGENLPRFDGEVRSVSAHLDHLKRGFRAVTDAILADREAFLGPLGPLAAFEGCPVRYLPRPTSHYASKLSQSLYSSRLRSGLQRSLALESLYSVYVPRTDDEELAGLVPTEKESISRLTIPRFTVPATGHELRDGRGNLQGVTVAESPLDHARRRVSALDDHRVETQLRLVDLAFTDSTVSDPVSAPKSDRSNAVPSADSAEAVVSNVVESIDDATTRYPDGSLRWAELARSSSAGQFRVREPTLDLYRGHVGVGLFLAAVAAVRDDAGLAEQSRRLLKPTAPETEEASVVGGIGGIVGRGSVAYGLATAGDLLGDADLTERARTVAGRTTREEVAADEDLDVMEGAAGELLAQLAVYERTGDSEALERARWCGDRLLGATTDTASGYRVPTTADSDSRFAFAHGVGGIGNALVRLGDATGDERYVRVGRDALGFDLELWRRGRKPANDAAEDEHAGETGDGTIWGWCNGVAGVGTSQMGVASASSAEWSAVRSDLRTELSREDSLCCGSAGRALFLLDAGDVFEEPSLTERGEALFERMLDRAEREGRLRLANHLPMLPRLGLFTGVAGIGYVALAIEANDAGVELPNVMRLE